METLQILAFSPKTSFSKKIKGSLSPDSGFQINNIPSLPGEIPPELENGSWIGMVDMDQFAEPLEKIVETLREKYSDKLFLLLSDETTQYLDLIPPDIYLLDIKSLSNFLFPPFLKSLAEKSALISAKEKVETDLNKRLSELLLIRKASLHLTMNLSLDSVLESILESAMELVSAGDTHVFLYDHGVLSFAAALFDGHQQKNLS